MVVLLAHGVKACTMKHEVLVVTQNRFVGGSVNVVLVALASTFVDVYPSYSRTVMVLTHIIAVPVSIPISTWDVIVA